MRAFPLPGVYVDVGAGSPDRASVTRLLHENGWNGVHVEPRPDLAAELVAARPGDVVVRAAASDRTGSITLHVVAEDGDLSTTASSQAAELTRQGMTVTPVTVPTLTLNELLTEAGIGPVDVLKIDVEGAEADVLRGADLRHWRPKVILIEATRPNSAVPTFGEWEHLLTAQGYCFASTDGLNRYYVRADLEAALGPLLVPANPTDHYVPAGVVLLEQEVDRLRGLVADTEQRLAATAARLARLELAAPPRATSRTLDPALDRRVLLVGTPFSGADFLRGLLAEALGSPQRAIAHPADLPWGELPPRLVVELSWRRTEHLRRLLATEQVAVASLVRHPLDVLLAVLLRAQDPDADGLSVAERAMAGAGPDDEAFLQWAESPPAVELLALTPLWWRDQSTLQLRYDDLVADPSGTVIQVLTELGLDAAAEMTVPPPSSEISLRWKDLLTPAAVQRLSPFHADVLAELGFAAPTGGVVALAGVATWASLL